MHPVFRRIRIRLVRPLQRLYARLQDAQLTRLRRRIEWLRQDEQISDPTEFEALDNEVRELEIQRRMQLHAIVGQALSAWARMEESLVGVATVLLETKIEKGGIVMYSIINFNVWTSIIGELFQVDKRFDALIPKWNKISSKLRALKNTRDNLAHHTINLPDESIMPFSEAWLRPASFDTRLASKKYRPLTYDQIAKFIDSVMTTLEQLSELLNSMTKILSNLPLQQKSSEPTPDQAHP